MPGVCHASRMNAALLHVEIRQCGCSSWWRTNCKMVSSPVDFYYYYYYYCSSLPVSPFSVFLSVISLASGKTSSRQSHSNRSLFTCLAPSWGQERACEAQSPATHLVLCSFGSPPPQHKFWSPRFGGLPCLTPSWPCGHSLFSSAPFFAISQTAWAGRLSPTFIFHSVCRFALSLRLSFLPL